MNHAYIEIDLREPTPVQKRHCPIYKPWVLVSALDQRDEEGEGVLGLGVCRGLMEEFKLLRMAFGAAELARE